MKGTVDAFTRNIFMMDERKVLNLTVDELQALIRQTVRETVAEVIIELNIMAEAEQQVEIDAAMADYLRTTMKGLDHTDKMYPPKLDD